MTSFAHDSRSIFDLGMNNGDDADYYLKLGYGVVAVEANPILCEKAAVRFAGAVAEGRLTIVNGAIWEKSGETTFHVNLANDHWSSIDPNWAQREGTQSRAIQVACVTLPELFERYGVPWYLKIDVEGVDQVVLEQLLAVDVLPAFVSVEDCRFGFDYMRTLAACGFDGFKLLDQSSVPGRTDPANGHVFPAGSSGPLGRDIEGEWLSYDEVLAAYSTLVRDRDGNRIAPRTQWWDIHCTRRR